MSPDTALGLSVEFQRFLKGDWNIIEEPNRFRIKNNDGSVAGAKLRSYVRDTAWQIARDMGYLDFVSLSEDADGQITIVSRTVSGEEFEIIFEI